MDELFFWNKVLNLLENKRGKEVTKFLFSNSKFLKLDDEQLIVKVDILTLPVISSKNSEIYIDIKTIVDDILQKDMNLLFVIDEKNIDLNYAKEIPKVLVEEIKWDYEKTNLNMSYTFENYFYSYENRNIIEAAKQIINEIEKNTKEPNFNPFFLYGASGIGKTHFVNALGNELFKKNVNKKILYKNATEFFNEYTSLFKGSLNNKNLEEFKNLYFNLDVFIIDDIQMLATKEGSLNEFFSVFEHMRVNNKYVIITSDVRPNILKFEDRLLTRFLSGLVVEFNFPDSDTKTQIFKYHANKIDLKIDEQAIQVFINYSKNVRELLGYINSIKVDLITNDIDDFEYKEDDAINIVSKTTGLFKNITKKEILNIICKYYSISENELKEKNRNQKLVKARNIAVYFLKNKLNLTFKEISLLLGMKDHTNAVKIIKNFNEFKEKNKEDYKSISQKINNKK